MIWGPGCFKCYEKTPHFLAMQTYLPEALMTVSIPFDQNSNNKNRVATVCLLELRGTPVSVAVRKWKNLDSIVIPIYGLPAYLGCTS
jgi:hypothetical protein